MYMCYWGRGEVMMRVVVVVGGGGVGGYESGVMEVVVDVEYGGVVV